MSARRKRNRRPLPPDLACLYEQISEGHPGHHALLKAYVDVSLRTRAPFEAHIEAILGRGELPSQIDGALHSVVDATPEAIAFNESSRLLNRALASKYAWERGTAWATRLRVAVDARTFLAFVEPPADSSPSAELQ